ncbi:MAG: hypothetical protein LBT29_03560 [Flavobacteriaceae bacterium]|jgi:hypothetical protein|nr:hypothetical protein [Flavobacteriaceae bacterium]
MKKYLIILASVLFMFSCDESSPVGLQDDTIKLSTKELSIGAEGGTAVVTSEGNHWALNWVYTNGAPIPPQDMVITTQNYEKIKFESDWFTIFKENSQKLVFTISANKTGQQRGLSVGLMDANYGTYISLTQSAE